MAAEAEAAREARAKVCSAWKPIKLILKCQQYSISEVLYTLLSTDFLCLYRIGTVSDLDTRAIFLKKLVNVLWYETF